MSHTRIRRRDLLAWSSAAALLPALPRMARAQAALAPAGQPSPRGMSVGFVEGSDLWPSFQKLTAGTLARGRRATPEAEAAAVSVTPAARMIAGDQGLVAQTVRVGVHGLYPVPNPNRVEKIDLTVLFTSDDPAAAAPLPFYAWSYRLRPAPSPSPPVKFVAPIGPDGSLQMQLDAVPVEGPLLITRRGSVGLATPEPPGGRFAADFTVDWHDGRPKLQRGVYLLGMAGDTWASSRTLPLHRPGQPRPVELLSLIVSVDPVIAA